MPHLKALVERHKDDPFAVIGINCFDQEADYRKGLEEHGLTWISAYHGAGENPVAKLYQVAGFPTYYLIDAEGRIVSKGSSGTSFDEKIAELLAEMAEAEDAGEDDDPGGS